MKRVFLIISTVLIVCSPVCGRGSDEQVDFEYVEGINFGEPIYDGDWVKIPFEFSGKKWMEESTLYLKRVECDIDGNSVVMRVFASSSEEGKLDLWLGIAKSMSDTYDIIFEDPDGTLHSLTTIKFNWAEQVAGGDATR